MIPTLQLSDNMLNSKITLAHKFTPAKPTPKKPGQLDDFADHAEQLLSPVTQTGLTPMQESKSHSMRRKLSFENSAVTKKEDSPKNPATKPSQTERVSIVSIKESN